MFGIIDKIIDFIDRKLLDKDKRVIENYILKTNKEFDVDNLIDKTPTHIIEKYKKLSNYKIFNDIAKRFEETEKRVNAHNTLVNNIISSISSFDYQSIISSINNYDESYFISYDKTINSINSFKSKTKKSATFVNTITKVRNDLNIIKNQFDSITIMKQLINSYFDQDKYFDGREKEEYISNLTKFKGYFEKQYVDKKYYSIDFINQELSNIENRIEIINKKYIDRHVNDELFNDVNNWPLSEDQKSAVLCDSRSNLVIAGAGSGKTLTICGKAKYLIEELKVRPNDILFLSYSKASADDLERKLKGVCEQLSASTFHSLGMQILTKSENLKQNVESSSGEIIERFFREEMTKDKHHNTFMKIFDFYARFASAPTDKKYDSKGEMYEDLANSDFTTLKKRLSETSRDDNEKETMKKEIVKSYEEMVIANYLFVNGINYRYESPYEFNTATHEFRQYNPDFTITTDNGDKIYYEHYGVNEDGECTQYSKTEAERYKRTMEWKNELHEKDKNNYIQTFSYQFKNSTIFNEIDKHLEDFGIVKKPLSKEQIVNTINSVYEDMQFKSLIRLITTFINLYKARYVDDSMFVKLMSDVSFEHPYHKQRAILFIDICRDIFNFYKSELNGKIDFDDMILKATSALKHMNSFKYKYIVVDEFQDISFSRVNMLKGLIEHGNSKLFAVGDDWQSIYRFAGSDISIFINFKNFFEMSTSNKLATNFRNSSEMHEIVNAFITKNPEQIKKEIVCNKRQTDPVVLVYHNSKEKLAAFNKTLEEISKLDSKAKILVLGRNTGDIKFATNKHENEEPYVVLKEGLLIHKQFPDLELTYMTVHRSKGLEYDYVIVVNNEDSRTGFPNQIEDDPLLMLVLSDKSSFLYAEERRLFYVALTRAKLKCYLIVNAINESSFISEIKDMCAAIDKPTPNNEDTIILCPECRTSPLVKRQYGDNKEAYGCTNFPLCNYFQMNTSVVEHNDKCPECGYFMIELNGKYGRFKKCTNKTYCEYKFSIKE